MSKRFNGNKLAKIGFKPGPAMGLAIKIAATKPYSEIPSEKFLDILEKMLACPQDYLSDETLRPLAEELIKASQQLEIPIVPLNDAIIPYKTYGADGIDTGAKLQMDTALRLPISRAGALMADAHTGYGLPIGGVLATEDAIIPYAVGVDIGCRMCMSIFDVPDSYIQSNRQVLKHKLLSCSKFGFSEVHTQPSDHEIFDRAEFKDIAVVKSLKEKARIQLGTSGGGNHFVEFGVVELLEPSNEFGMPMGKYMGLLTHSGSRGLGANIAGYFTKLAMAMTNLPKEAEHLAWLDIDSEEGQEYWLAMNLAGDYASACHHDIHQRIAQSLGLRAAAMVENHHNFAWKQIIDGKEMIVHRKGATPAAAGVLGIIPGSMTAPGFIVRGKGNANSLASASHGAGRALSRTKAKATVTESALSQHLEAHGVLLIGGGVDEAPMAYKDINKVMEYQQDLVDIVGSFLPKVVRMANDQEPAWRKKKPKITPDGFLDGE